MHYSLDRIFDEKGKDVCSCWDIIPPRAIPKYIYRCDRYFHTASIEELYEDKEKYGLVYIDGNGYKIYTFVIINNRLDKKQIFSDKVDLAKNHKKGGQSQARIGRLHDESHFNYITKVCTQLRSIYLTNGLPNIKGLVICGNAQKKDNLEKRLDPILQNIILGCLKCDSINKIENWCVELVKNEDELKQNKILIDIMNIENPRCIYGIKEVKRAFRLGQLKQLVIHCDVLKISLNKIKEKCESRGCILNIVTIENKLSDKFINGFGGIGGISWYTL